MARDQSRASRNVRGACEARACRRDSKRRTASFQLVGEGGLEGRERGAVEGRRAVRGGGVAGMVEGGVE